MLTLRRFLSAQYDWTGIAPKLLQSEAWYIGSLIFGGDAHLAADRRISPLVREDAESKTSSPRRWDWNTCSRIITYYTLTVILVPLLLLVSRVFRIWRLTMNADEQARTPFSAYVAESWTYVLSVGDSFADAEVPGPGPMARVIG